MEVYHLCAQVEGGDGGTLERETIHCSGCTTVYTPPNCVMKLYYGGGTIHTVLITR